VDRLLERGRRTANLEERQKTYREIVGLLHTEVPEIPIAFMPYFFGVRSHLKGFETDLDASYFFGSGGIPMAWLDR
jgi:ABC-type transport system substrate-binding protein